MVMNILRTNKIFQVREQVSCRIRAFSLRCGQSFLLPYRKTSTCTFWLKTYSEKNSILKRFFVRNSKWKTTCGTKDCALLNKTTKMPQTIHWCCNNSFEYFDDYFKLKTWRLHESSSVQTSLKDLGGTTN